MTKDELDPWRVLRSFLSRPRSRDVPDIIDRTGLRVDWTLTEEQDSTNEALASDDDRLRVAFIVASELARRDLGDDITQALRQIGWELREKSLAAVGSSVRELFFPDGSHHDAYVQIRELLKQGVTSIDLIDPYVDGSVLVMLNATAKPNMRLRVLTMKCPKDFGLECQRWQSQNPDKTLEVRTATVFHDRFLVLDGTRCWHIGASIKDAGNKVFMVSEVEDPTNRAALIEQISKSWVGASPLR